MIMDTWLCSVFITLYYFVTLKSSYQALLKIATKKVNAHRVEDYTFEGELSRARDECSYISLVNDTLLRNRTVERIKEKIAERKAKEFYREKEAEKRRAKEYYRNLERQAMRRVLEEEGASWDPGLVRPVPFPSPRAIPPARPFPPPRSFPPPPYPFPQRTLYKRSSGSRGRRRKGPAPFSRVSFMDHNNCSSRCLFARMEMVDEFGFPDESLMTKLIDDKIADKEIRLLKTKAVGACFKKMEEVALDDSCIFATKLFECLDLGESSSWYGRK